jgi:putative endonuclease
MEKAYCVYILSSRSRVLYVGVTSRLIERVKEHRESTKPSFTTRYRIHRLVYFESYRYVRTAITREKQIKAFSRAKKIALIESTNPAWDDLTAKYFPQYPKTADSSLRSE